MDLIKQNVVLPPVKLYMKYTYHPVVRIKAGGTVLNPFTVSRYQQDEPNTPIRGLK